MRVLVVEDDVRVAGQVGEMLRGAGYVVELTGEGGYEGLSMVVTVHGDYGVGVIVPTDAVPTQPEPPLAEAAE